LESWDTAATGRGERRVCVWFASVRGQRSSLFDGDGGGNRVLLNTLKGHKGTVGIADLSEATL
jgi:hypothetical protein